MTLNKMLVEEMDFNTFTWPRLETAFDRPRRRLREVLMREGRQDLIAQTNRATYGSNDPNYIRDLRRWSR